MSTSVTESILSSFSFTGDNELDTLTRTAEVLIWVVSFLWIIRQFTTGARTSPKKTSKSWCQSQSQSVGTHSVPQRSGASGTQSSGWFGRSGSRRGSSANLSGVKAAKATYVGDGDDTTARSQQQLPASSRRTSATAAVPSAGQSCDTEDDRYVKLLKLYCKSGGGLQAAQLLTEMKNLGMPAPQALYIQVMMACAREQKWRTVLQIFQELSSLGRGEKLTTASYTVAIDASAKSGKWEKALELMQEMLEKGPKPDASCWHAAMHACAKKGRMDQALQLLQDMEHHGEKPDVVTFSAAINACANSEEGRWEQAIGLLNRMQQLGVRPNVVCYSVAIKACAKSDQWESALGLLEAIRERGLQRNVITYNAAIDACAKGFQWQKALELLQEMQADGLQPNATTCNSAIKACARGGQCHHALELLKGMRGWQVEPDVITYNEAMSACANCGDMDRALELLGEMRQQGLRPDTVNHNVVIRGCATNGKWPEALEVLRGMQSFGPKPNITSYHLAIDACTAGNAAGTGLELMEEMWQQGLKATGNANQVQAVMKACALPGHREVSLNCWQDIRRYDVRPYAFISKVIKHHVSNNNLAKAREFVEELQKQGLRPTANVCGPAYAALELGRDSADISQGCVNGVDLDDTGSTGAGDITYES